jgi:hypothetical protein
MGLFVSASEHRVNTIRARTVALGDFNAERYPQSEMFRALYRQIVRFLDWINRSGSGSNASAAVREAENHRRDLEDRYPGSGSGGWGP